MPVVMFSLIFLNGFKIISLLFSKSFANSLKQRFYIAIGRRLFLNDFSYFKRNFIFPSDCNCARTHNLLVHKRTLNHLAKLVTTECGFILKYVHDMTRTYNHIF